MPLLNCSYQEDKRFSRRRKQEKSESTMWILVSFAAMVRSCHATNSVSRRLQEIIVVPIEASLGGGGRGGEGKKSVEMRQKTAARRLMNGPHLQC